MLARATLAILVTGIIILVLTPTIMMTSRNAAAQTTTATTTSNTSTVTTPSAPDCSSKKIFYLFSAEHEGVNETKLGIPPDRYSPDVLEVTEGDNVTIHFYNLDNFLYYCKSMKLDLLTNTTVVDEAISFVSANDNEQGRAGRGDRRKNIINTSSDSLY